MPTENAPRGGNAFYADKYGKGKGKDKGKSKGKDYDKGKRGTKRNRDTDTSLSSFASSSSSAPAHRPNTLASPRTHARSSHPNTIPPDPTVTAGSMDGFFPTPATSAKESSNLTTGHASTQHLLQVLLPLETRTSNPRTNHGGFEGTWKTIHNVFHLRSHISNLRCHNRGCYSQSNPTLPQPTSLLLPGLPGSTNINALRLHNRGCNLNYYQTTLLAHNPRSLLSPLCLTNNLRLYHHPLGPRSTSPPCAAQQSRLRVQPSTTPPRQTARPHSLPG
jgi:hypothetical protein